VFLVFRAEAHLSRANPTLRDFGNFTNGTKRLFYLAAKEQEHAEREGGAVGRG
jgi:hypothetical protein